MKERENPKLKDAYKWKCPDEGKKLEPRQLFNLNPKIWFWFTMNELFNYKYLRKLVHLFLIMKKFVYTANVIDSQFQHLLILSFASEYKVKHIERILAEYFFSQCMWKIYPSSAWQGSTHVVHALILHHFHFGTEIPGFFFSEVW